jgi:hypothetical protein
MFVDVLNPTQKYLTIDGIAGVVTTADGTIIGDYKLGKTVLSPGAKNVRISWGSRATTTLIPLAIGIFKGNWPVLKFKTIMNVKGFPIPTSFTLNTKDYKPTLV